MNHRRGATMSDGENRLEADTRNELRGERRAGFSREDQERVDLSFEVRATRMRSSSRR
jgi:hypothetical protein